MPTISLFYGIVVMMFYRDTDRHHLPHIHVRYASYKASVAIEDGRVLEGAFPARQLKLVQAWVELRREDLMVDWELAVAGEPVLRISPLL